MATSKNLINALDDVVSDAIDGLLYTNPSVRRVEGLNIVVRADIAEYKESHVTLISGGGSGHEPAHAGYVAAGMLSAGVCGNIFASPSVSSILAAIRVCCGPCGCILIIKNYTGDRLNFGMAAEQAQQEGFLVKTLVVEDDKALQQGKGITGGRGIAGTVFVHKLLGAASARQFAPIDEVYRVGTEALANLGSMGLAVKVCTVPGTATSGRLDRADAMELGLGIHGEPGREQVVMRQGAAATQVAELLVGGVLSRLPVAAGEGVALLLNNLGAVPGIEMNVVLKSVMIELQEVRGIRVERVYCGPYMTAIDMTGLSLSLLRLTPPLASLCSADLLDQPTDASAWVRSPDLGAAASTNRTIDAPAGLRPVKPLESSISCPNGLAAAVAVATAMVAIEPALSEYDRICGDGDCGIVMKRGAERVLADIGTLSTEQSALLSSDGAQFCNMIANAIGASMGGSLGVLLEIFFRRVSSHLSQCGPGGGWSGALQDGLDAVKQYGGAAVGMRTMLDALEPAVLALEAGAAASAEAAGRGMESTKTMAPLAGRSNYVQAEMMAGTPDPGAFAVYMAFKAAAEIL